MANYWRDWARRCLAAMDGKADLPEAEDARASFEQVVRLGVEPYHWLKGYAVRHELEMMRRDKGER